MAAREVAEAGRRVNLDVAVAGSLVLYRLVASCKELAPAGPRQSAPPGSHADIGGQSAAAFALGTTWVREG
jgi:hypothetical protein